MSKLRAYFPSAVPQGMAEFDIWAKSIITIYDFPDNDSVRFALATMILHSGPTAAYLSKRYLALMVKAGAAKQIAGAQFQEIKQRRVEAEKAEAAKLAEATASMVATDVQSIRN